MFCKNSSEFRKLCFVGYGCIILYLAITVLWSWDVSASGASAFAGKSALCVLPSGNDAAMSCLLAVYGYTGRSLKSFAVFFFVLVVEHAEIRLVSAFRYVVLFHGAEHGTPWLMAVGAVAETAVVREVEYLLEIACQFFRLDVECSEPLYSRRVNDISAARQFEHLAESGGVHAGVVCVADFRCAQVHAGQYAVYQCRLAYAAVAAQHGNLVFEQIAQAVDTAACGRRYGPALVSYVVVERHHQLLIPQFVVGQYVAFVEHQHHRYAVCLGRGEKAVNESGGGLRLVHRDHEKCHVHVGCDDVALLRQVWRFAYDVVPAVVYRRDKGRAFRICHYVNPVAHGHRVGAADAFQSEVSFYLAVYQPSVVCLYCVPTACVLDY